MSQYPQYSNNNVAVAVGNGGENNLYNVPGSDMNMFLKQIIGNTTNNNIVPQTMNSLENQYYQQNKIPNQYFIPMSANYPQTQQQYMPMFPFPNQNFIYLNPQNQFSMNNPTTTQYVQSVLPMHMNNNGTVPIDNENSQNVSTNPRSKKKTYKLHAKQEPSLLNLVDDIPRDTRNRPLSFCCGVCSKRFSTQTRLDQHNLCHTGERPFVCKECNFAFTQKSYLVRHAAVHKDERSFECELCKKTYKHYGSLANHRKTHKNGSKQTNGQMDSTVNNLQEDNIINCKVEETIDTNGHSTNTYPTNNTTEYAFQNPTDIQQLDHNQSYASQFTNDISDGNFSSFRNLLSSENSADFTSSFTHQLNYSNDNFYALVANTNPATNRDSLSNLHENQTDLINLSAVKTESTYLSSLKESDPNDEFIPTYTV